MMDPMFEDYLQEDSVVQCMIITVPRSEGDTGINASYKAMAWYSDRVDHPLLLKTALLVAATYMPGTPPGIQRYVGAHYEVNLVQEADCKQWASLTQTLCQQPQGVRLPQYKWIHRYRRSTSMFSNHVSN